MQINYYEVISVVINSHPSVDIICISTATVPTVSSSNNIPLSVRSSYYQYSQAPLSVAFFCVSFVFFSDMTTVAYKITLQQSRMRVSTLVAASAEAGVIDILSLRTVYAKLDLLSHHWSKLADDHEKLCYV